MSAVYERFHVLGTPIVVPVHTATSKLYSHHTFKTCDEDGRRAFIRQVEVALYQRRPRFVAVDDAVLTHMDAMCAAKWRNVLLELFSLFWPRAAPWEQPATEAPLPGMVIVPSRPDDVFGR